MVLYKDQTGNETQVVALETFTSHEQAFRSIRESWATVSPQKEMGTDIGGGVMRYIPPHRVKEYQIVEVP